MSRTMPALAPNQRIEMGRRAASGHMYRQDKIWSKYSNDKVDIAHTLTRVLRTLYRSLPLDQPLVGLSIGSSNEPQFRILESACLGGLYLLDIEEAALAVVEERIERQNTRQVQVIHGDYREVLQHSAAVQAFRDRDLQRQRLTLITLHHSLYYSPKSFWNGLLINLYEHLLAQEPQPGPTSAIHAVLMASRSDDPATTTWLYNHFAERFFGAHNDQDLRQCAAELRADAHFADAEILCHPSRIQFFVDDFEQFMAVIWMILLHPNVHQFSEPQQDEVTEWVYENLWSRGQPLMQEQDHLIIYRGGAERQ